MQKAASVSVSIRNVVKTFGTTPVLRDVSLDVPSGSFTTLLGASGSGKTTLLLVVAGFIRPEQGRLLFNDRDIMLEPPHRRDIGIVFQNYALFPHLDVFHNVAYPLRVRGHNRDDIRKRVDHVLAMVRLQGMGDRMIHQISGGQRQRVALARAMVFEPRVLLMDEPLSALDKGLREEMQLEIKRLHTEWATTTICVTHDQREALTMSDYVAVMDEGRILQVDDPHRIYNRPNSAFVAGFIGEASFLAARNDGGTLTYGGRHFRLPDDVAVPAQPALVVRPERLQILAAEQREGLNVLDGIVAARTYQGDSLIVRIKLADGSEVVVRGQTREDIVRSIPESGHPIRLGLAPADTIVVPAAA